MEFRMRADRPKLREYLRCVAILALVLQAANAELAVKAAGKRIEISRVALDQAREVLASVTRRYEGGAASNVDLIDAQTAYNGARTDFITAVHDRSIADLQFRLATGQVSR